MNAVCQHSTLGNSQPVLQHALCSGKYTAKQQAEWRSRDHSYIPSEKNLYAFYFTCRKPWKVSSEMLCSSHKSCLEQPAPLASYRHHCTLACSPFLLSNTKKPWIHLIKTMEPFLFLPFISNTCWNKANSMLFSCCSFILLNSKQSRAGHTQTSHYSLLSQSYKMSKNPIYLHLIQINYYFSCWYSYHFSHWF